MRVVKIIRYRGDLGVRVLETEANRPLPVGVGALPHVGVGIPEERV